MTLIIYGTSLFVTPFITHAFLGRQVTNAMVELNKSFNLQTNLPRSHETAGATTALLSFSFPL